jgi:hypothetical protein
MTRIYKDPVWLRTPEAIEARRLKMVEKYGSMKAYKAHMAKIAAKPHKRGGKGKKIEVQGDSESAQVEVRRG